MTNYPKFRGLGNLKEFCSNRFHCILSHRSLEEGALSQERPLRLVKHRNHLSVMSVKNAMSNICKVIDFRQVSTPNFNLDASNIINQPQVSVQQGKALWAGNALYDTDIIYQGTQNDVNVIYTQVVNAGSNFFVSPGGTPLGSSSASSYCVVTSYSPPPTSADGNHSAVPTLVHLMWGVFGA